MKKSGLIVIATHLALTACNQPAHWMTTSVGKGYVAIIRLYGPAQSAIDKSWVPGDIEKVQ